MCGFVPGTIRGARRRRRKIEWYILSGVCVRVCARVNLSESALHVDCTNALVRPHLKTEKKYLL